MNMFSALIANLIEHPHLEVTIRERDEGIEEWLENMPDEERQKGNAHKYPGSRAMMCSNAFSRATAIRRYVEVVKNGPTTTKALATTLGLKNVRTMLGKLVEEGYIRCTVPDSKRGPKEQKVWVYTGKALPPLNQPVKKGPYK